MASQDVFSASALEAQLLVHCNSIALHPSGAPFPASPPAAAAPSFLSHPQHFASAPSFFSAASASQPQQSAGGAWGWQSAKNKTERKIRSKGL